MTNYGQRTRPGALLKRYMSGGLPRTLQRLISIALTLTLALGVCAATLTVVSIPAAAQDPTPTAAQALTIDPAPAVSTSTPPVDSQNAPRPSIQISPAIVDNTLDPGTTMTLKMIVRNTSDFPMGIRGSLSALMPEQEVDPTFTKVYDASSWFQLQTSDFLLNAGEAREVPAILTVPTIVEPGGHYATIYFQSYVPQVGDVATQARLNARVGVIVMLTVRGDVKEKVTIASPIRVPKYQFQAGPTNAAINIRNEGNVHVLPSGSVLVRNMFGKKVAEMRIPLGYLLPGTKREYPVIWEHGAKIGIYHLESTVTVGSQRTTLKPQGRTVVLLPLVIVLPIVFAVIVALWVSIRLARRKRRRTRTRSVRFLQSIGEENDNNASEAAMARPTVGTVEESTNPTFESKKLKKLKNSKREEHGE